MSLDDVKHVEAYSIIKRLVERPDLEGRDAGLQWLEENPPETSAYVAAAKSLGVELTPCRHGYGRNTCSVCCSKTDAEIDAEIAAGAPPNLGRQAADVAEYLRDIPADEWPFDDDPPDPL